MIANSKAFILININFTKSDTNIHHQDYNHHQL